MTHPIDRSRFLSIKNDWYRGVLLEFWHQQKKWDGEDITANILFGDENSTANATITAKSTGVLAGREEAEFFLEHENLQHSFLVSDGSNVSKGDVVLEISGDAKHLLKTERALLNFLSRLSGIATLTSEAKKKIPDSVLLCPTRKTLWGPIDKKGVAVGGGGTHRLGLFDAVLVKENHISLLANGITDVKRKMTYDKLQITNKITKTGDVFWEVEVETEDEFNTLLQNLTDARPGVIMFDNFSPNDISRLIKKTLIPEGIYLEASGGITLQNIAKYSKTGVSALSCGFLTNAATPVDFSMRIKY
jgi:nicotinate-nucleotide pyrophosphorylase (carboxylating)